MNRDQISQASPCASVLVVDDEPALCNAIRMILELDGYHVDMATNGADAVTQAVEAHPAVVLLDLCMPGMDGWQTQHLLRERVPEVPVVFMTAGDKVWREAASHQAAGGLRKPFDVDTVLDTVARFIPSPAP